MMLNLNIFIYSKKIKFYHFRHSLSKYEKYVIFLDIYVNVIVIYANVISNKLFYQIYLHLLLYI